MSTNLAISLKRVSKVYHEGESIAGVAVVESSGEVRHEGLSLSMEGSVNLQVSTRNVGIFEAFSNSIKPINLINTVIELAPPGKIPAGTTEIPFEMPLRARQAVSPGYPGLLETYHGVFVNNIRTFCTADVTMSTLSGTGLLEIGQGCTIKTELFTIHSHNNFLRKVNVEPSIEAPEVSILNSVTMTSGASYNFTAENHEQAYRRVLDEINDLKQQSESSLSIHDVHQYSIIYGMLAVLVVLAILAACLRARRRCCMELAAPPGGEAPVSAAAHTRARAATSASCERYLTSECGFRETVSMDDLGLNKDIAPTKPPRQSVSIPIPCDSFGDVVEPTEGK